MIRFPFKIKKSIKSFSSIFIISFFTILISLLNENNWRLSSREKYVSKNEIEEINTKNVVKKVNLGCLFVLINQEKKFVMQIYANEINLKKIVAAVLRLLVTMRDYELISYRCLSEKWRVGKFKNFWFSMAR